MTETLIPRNNIRKSSRALIDRAWQSGNRRADDDAAPEIVGTAGSKPEKRDQIARKIEEKAARRVRVRGLRF